MGLRVDTHIASLLAPRRQQPVAGRPFRHGRLGSGLRITAAADEAAGLAPAERLRVCVRSLERAKHGADGCSLQQQAGIVLDEVDDILTRVRELSAGNKATHDGAANLDARIRDADVALATAQATRSSILRQATVRAQANVLPQSAQRLLR